jgi:hypothetical protein
LNAKVVGGLVGGIHVDLRTGEKEEEEEDARERKGGEGEGGREGHMKRMGLCY